MQFNDRGFIVWLQLLPPTLLLALSAMCIVLLDYLELGNGKLVQVCLALMGVAALWLLRIGLAQWHIRD
ncbi:MAG: hypothetical protein R3270_01170 [Gammaproteobacteria bacterium]|nr:hypothetical protein [Gammaproteobacteria bacterium]